jgi:hypothetical protein
MKTEFSLFNGFDSYEFIEPFDYWSDFIDDVFADSKFETDIQKIHFHCCVIPENVDLKEDNFLLGFFKKLPFFTLDKESSITHLWWLTPELIPLLSTEPNNFNPDKLATFLLDSIFQLLSNQQFEGNAFMNLSDVKIFINNAKNKVIEDGLFQIREKYKLKHENDFKNKYYL